MIGDSLIKSSFQAFFQANNFIPNLENLKSFEQKVVIFLISS